MPIRFHLDEHIPASIAAGLRRRNIDVTTSTESGNLGVDDMAQILFAASSGRVLVTHDADFLRLPVRGVAHAGIVYCQQGTVGIGEMLRRLGNLVALLCSEQAGWITGQVIYADGGASLMSPEVPLEIQLPEEQGMAQDAGA